MHEDKLCALLLPTNTTAAELFNSLDLSGHIRKTELVIFLKLIYLLLAALGLYCCARAFSSCGEWGLLFVAVRGLLIVVASLAVENGL